MTAKEELEAISAFLTSWEKVVAMGEEAVATNVAGNEAAWLDAKSAANRDYGRVRHLIEVGNVKNFSGQHSAFDYVLATVARLSWLASPGSSHRSTFRQAASIGTAAIERKRGELGQLASQPVLENETERLASETGLDKFVDDLRTAERRLRDEDWRDATHNARAALEVCTKQFANRLVLSPSERNFANAVEVLETRGVLDTHTAKSWTAKDIGLYGWLSNRGSHREDGGPEYLVGPAEARFAVTQSRSAIEFLLRKFLTLQDG